jgi:glyoxylase-like metal-dependent hydrolase (beta-lactamase superfamily II)
MAMQAGIVQQLSSRVRRLVAPNPGPMTGAGTNTYLIGTDDVAVLDPGPAIPEHIERIVEAGAGKITRLVCTHTHPDHSPAAAVIASRLGVPMIGALTADDQHQDRSFVPDEQLTDGSLIAGGDWQLRAIATPGHVDNHFCFLLEEEGMVFAGDHIMNGSTVVIVPPGGNMKAYIASLERLLDFPVSAIAPGHGEIIPDCRGEVEKLVRHRLMREAKVVAGLRQTGPATLDELVVVVYNDVDQSLHEWAKLSMLAHLIKLDEDGQVIEQGGRWRLSLD